MMMLVQLAFLIHLLNLKQLGSLPLLADGELLWKVIQNCYCFFVVVEPLVYFAFLFFNETVITKAQGLVVAIAKN